MKTYFMPLCAKLGQKQQLALRTETGRNNDNDSDNNIDQLPLMNCASKFSEAAAKAQRDYQKFKVPLKCGP